MKHRITRLALLLNLTLTCLPAFTEDRSGTPGLEINEQDYFEAAGLNVTVFADIYPDGHQTGVSVIQHGERVAANGDIRLEASPGQWSPVPKGGELTVDRQAHSITQALSYPDESKNRKGFNPIDYPDLELDYKVIVTALQGNSFRISVDFDKPIPAQWVGKIGFNFELFPGHLFGKGWLLDEASGYFAQQPNGPMVNVDGEFLNRAMARGKRLVVAPGDPMRRMIIEANQGALELLDGRSNHNNGWFIVRSLVPAGATRNAIDWTVTPHTVKDWHYTPVIQVSQLGYAPEQAKRVIIEQDKRDTKADVLTLYKLGADGRERVAKGKVKPWGEFLRYNYFTFDFSDITEPGLYTVAYRGKSSHTFKIDREVYARHAWQPTLEYFLPVQMCHMRVMEKYRVWHGLCHEDDALMSPVDTNHFDGYVSGSSTLTKYDPLEPVPGLNQGGWHDAGDYDLRVESQIGTTWLLAMMVEQFDLDYDATLIDQQRKLVEIHQPDGRNDALQQIEHGLLTVLGGYEALGRLYRGIIVPTHRQYVHLGDAATQTDNKAQSPSGEGVAADDRWVFTEQNPERELYVAAGLAAAARVLEASNPGLSKRALYAAVAVFDAAAGQGGIKNEAFALAELALTTGEQKYLDALVRQRQAIIENIADTGWAIGRVMGKITDEEFRQEIDTAVGEHQHQVRTQASKTPFGVPYEPYIWGAGWGIQSFGVKQYFFRQAWPKLTHHDEYVNALNFVLGVHPGQNTMSFASGVGAQSALVAYGVNRADWSYIPGGVISGTALIRPDLPELKIWPFFWQQTEYVMGGGATNYMFLVLAVHALYGQ